MKIYDYDDRLYLELLNSKRFQTKVERELNKYLDNMRGRYIKPIFVSPTINNQ